MDSKRTLEVVTDLLEAGRDGDRGRIEACLAEDVTFRIAGVPTALGGRVDGRSAVADFMMTNRGGGDVRTLFGDDVNVCVVSKVSGDSFPGNTYLKGGGQPFTTWQCSVYRVVSGEVAEIANYTNWADVYVQTGVIDIGSLLT